MGIIRRNLAELSGITVRLAGEDELEPDDPMFGAPYWHHPSANVDGNPLTERERLRLKIFKVEQKRIPIVNWRMTPTEDEVRNVLSYKLGRSDVRVARDAPRDVGAQYQVSFRGPVVHDDSYHLFVSDLRIWHAGILVRLAPGSWARTTAPIFVHSSTDMVAEQSGFRMRVDEAVERDARILAGAMRQSWLLGPWRELKPCNPHARAMPGRVGNGR